MLIHNLVATGSLSYNGVNISYVTGSQTSLDGLNQFSASVNTTTGSLNSTTGSLNTATGSLFTASGSFSTRVSNIEGNYATTGSNVFLGAQTVCANITSTGTIIAQTLNVQQVTSSIVYSSGSNIFGCSLTNTQQFTGSVTMTGSLNVAGNTCVVSICSPAHVGGTFSGTTIYGSTAICGGVICGGATTLTGALTGTSATFTNASGAFIGVTVTTTDTTGSARIRATSTGGNITDLISYSASHASRANQAWIGGDGSSTITVLQAGGTEFMRGSSTGNVGINETSPNSKLDIVGSSNAATTYGILTLRNSSNGGISLGASSTTYAWIQANNYGTGTIPLALQANGGNVGIGMTSPQAPLHIIKALGNDVISIGETGTNTRFTIGQEASYTGNYINSRNIDLKIQAYCAGGSGGNIIFQTANDGTANVVERMRISSGGSVCIGSAAVSGEILRVTGCSCLDNYISVYSGTIQVFLDADKTFNQGIVGTQSGHALSLRTSGTNRLTISTAGVLDFPGSNSTATSASDTLSFGVSSTTYAWIQSWGGRPLRINEQGNNVNAYGTNGYGLVNTTASDVRIKKNITSIENALDKVNCLRGVYYEFDENNSMCMKVPSGKRRVGLIAQEVACVLPEALLESQDDSTPISLDYSGMIGLLTKAIQEQQCKINILESCLGIN